MRSTDRLPKQFPSTPFAGISPSHPHQEPANKQVSDHARQLRRQLHHVACFDAVWMYIYTYGQKEEPRHKKRKGGGEIGATRGGGGVRKDNSSADNGTVEGHVTKPNFDNPEHHHCLMEGAHHSTKN